MKKFGGEVIFETEDAFGTVQVVQNEKGRHLHLDTLPQQSTLLPERPEKLAPKLNEVMMLSLLFNPEPKSALILGMGGGGLAKFLCSSFPECRIDAVELSPAVVQAAYDYFDLPKEERLSVHTEDALAFVEKEKKTYDLIIVDLFLGDGISNLVTDTRLFGHCHRLLSKGGILCWNTWKRTPEKLMVAALEALCLFFEDHLMILPVDGGELFEIDGTSCADTGNNIFFLFKKPLLKLTAEQLLKNAERLKESTGEEFPELFRSYNRFKGYGKLSFCK